MAEREAGDVEYEVASTDIDEPSVHVSTTEFPYHLSTPQPLIDCAHRGGLPWDSLGCGGRLNTHISNTNVTG